MKKSFLLIVLTVICLSMCACNNGMIDDSATDIADVHTGMPENDSVVSSAEETTSVSAEITTNKSAETTNVTAEKTTNASAEVSSNVNTETTTTESPVSCSHNWKDATCTTPKTCSKCNAAEGKAKGHTAVTDPAVAATCIKPGKTEGSHCSICNVVLNAQTEIAATGHSYADGKCSVCGALKYSEGLNISVYKDYCSVTGVGTCKDTTIVIPDTYNGLPVTSIGYDCFRDCYFVKNVIVPKSVTSIGGNAFYNCESLSGINLPDGITSIGYQAFYGCVSLTSINIPDSLTTLTHGVFRYCSGLVNVDIPDSVTNIDDLAFLGCNSLRSIDIPDSVTRIGKEAFWDCDSLTDIYIPDSVTIIGNSAFYACDNLASVNIPAGVTRIGSDTFGHCWKLKSITYRGTSDQWKNMNLANAWSACVTQVICSDDTINLD